MALITKRQTGEFGSTSRRGAPGVPGNPKVTFVDPSGIPYFGSQRNYSGTWGGGTSSQAPGGAPGGGNNPGLGQETPVAGTSTPTLPEPPAVSPYPQSLPGTAAGSGWWTTPAGKQLISAGIKLGIPYFMDQGWAAGTGTSGGSATGTLPWGAILNQGAIPSTAYASLMGLLLGQGKTDPAAMNELIASTQRGAQGTSQMIQGELARRGLGASGIGQALSGATLASGANKIADIRANEAQQAEARKRSDLDLFLRMFVQPSLDQTALATGQYNANAQRDADKQAALYAALAQGIGSIDWSALFS